MAGGSPDIRVSGRKRQGCRTILHQPALAGFLVDGRREGFVREPAYALAGQHAIGTGGFRLHDYLAHDDEMLQPAGRAFKAALASINGARRSLSWRLRTAFRKLAK